MVSLFLCILRERERERVFLGNHFRLRWIKQQQREREMRFAEVFSSSSSSSSNDNTSFRRRFNNERSKQQRGKLVITNVARSKGLRRRSRDGPNRSGKVAFFITVTRRRNSNSDSTSTGKGSSFSNDNGGGKYGKEDDDENAEDDKRYDEYGESLSSSSSFTSSNEERVAVIGALDAFGGWDSRECLQLVQTPNDAEKWTGKIDLSDDAAFSKTELKLVSVSYTHLRAHET